MTLLERLRDVSGLAQRADELDRKQNSAGIAHRRAEQLQAAAESLRAERVRARVLLDANVAVSLPPSPLDALEAYRDVTLDTPAKGDVQFKRLVRALDRTQKTLTQAIDKGIEVARQPIVEQKQGAASLESLAKIEGYEERVSPVLQLLGNLNKANWKNADANALRDLLEARSRVLEQIDQLQNEDVSEEVRAFFKVARVGGATLEQWTEEVQGFLQERGLMERIRIVLK